MPKIISYRIHLDEPTLVTSLDGDPNSAVAFPYIPGSVLRGFFITRYLQHYQVSELAAADDAIRNLFFNGQTRFLNGYPFINGIRSLPTPLSWRTLKDNDNKGYDFAWFGPNDFDQLKNQPVRVGKPFYVGFEGTAYTFTPLRTIDIHTNRSTVRLGKSNPRRYGRPREEAGAVYRYDALAKDQVFEASIIVDDNVDLTHLTPLLHSQSGYIGGARKSGYGKIHLDIDPIDDYQLPLSITSDHLVVTLLSDLILRDSKGKYGVNHHALTEYLQQKGIDVEIESTYDRAGLVGGFNRKWGLPLPQVSVLEMGSVYVYKIKGGSSQDLLQLVLHGLGDRRVDGFGQIGLNLWEAPEFALQTLQEQAQIPEAIHLSDETIRIGQGMLLQIARNRLEVRIQAEANRLIVGARNIPRRSQLTRLRTLIQSELLKPQSQISLQVLQSFSNDVEAREVARVQFERFRINGQRFLRWMMNTDNIQTLISQLEQEALAIGGIKFNGTVELQHFYQLKLVNAVLALAMKQERERE